MVIIILMDYSPVATSECNRLHTRASLLISSPLSLNDVS